MAESDATLQGDDASWQGWFDGACAPTNPGYRAIGALLIAPDGTEHTVSRATGRGTNNEAEYQALIALLELAIEQAAGPVKVHGDSQLVVNQAIGVWGVKTPNLQPFHRQVVALRKRVQTSLTWVPRELNSRADALASLGLPPEARLPSGPPGQGWGSLTDVGQRVNLSAVRVGRVLDALGLRGSDKQPTPAALDAGLARQHHNGFGIVAHWAVTAVAEVILDHGRTPGAQSDAPASGAQEQR